MITYLVSEVSFGSEITERIHDFRESMPNSNMQGSLPVLKEKEIL